MRKKDKWKRQEESSDLSPVFGNCFSQFFNIKPIQKTINNLTICVYVNEKRRNLIELRFSLQLLRYKQSRRCYIYTAAVEGATSAKTQFHHSLYQSDRSHPWDAREMQNDPVISVHLCFCEHYIKTNRAVWYSLPVSLLFLLHVSVVLNQTDTLSSLLEAGLG